MSINWLEFIQLQVTKPHSARSGEFKSDWELTLDNQVSETGTPLSISRRGCTSTWPPTGLIASSILWTLRPLGSQKTPKS